MSCLACLYRDQGKLSQAESLYLKALELGRRLSWEERLDTLRFVNGLAELYKLQQRLPKAEPLFVRELEGRCRVLGERHRDTLLAMNNLASLYSDLGELAGRVALRPCMEGRHASRGGPRNTRP